MYVCFQTGNIATTTVTFMDPKRTHLESYKNNLRVYLEIILRSIHTIRDVDLAADQLQQVIFMSYCNNCPAKITRSPWEAPWWNK
jgi:hypothetical protein